MIVRALCILTLAGCTLHSKAERPRVAIQNAVWFAGGAALMGLGYAVVHDLPGDAPFGVASGAAGGVMVFGAILGLLGVAFDDVPDK